MTDQSIQRGVAAIVAQLADAQAEVDRFRHALEAEFAYWLTLGPGRVDGNMAARRIRRILDPEWTEEEP